MPAKLLAGNWKMNGLRAALPQIAEIAARSEPGVTTVICPPATLLAAASALGVATGGQDCHPHPKGAHTGDISAENLADAGASYVILGHSERRNNHGEADATIAAKAEAAWRAGLVAIICIGETEAQNRAGQTLAVLARQLEGSLPETATPANTVVAYEPVWAIGNGRTPTDDQIATTHAAIRAHLARRLPGGDRISLLYGGSVNASNAARIFAIADVDGGLVGGASLRAADFLPILHVLSGAKP
ncbi:TpiA Triosephosphate isomerase [Paracoccaceae bacterium]